MSIIGYWKQFLGGGVAPVDQEGTDQPPGTESLPKLSELVDGHICRERYDRIAEIAKSLAFMPACDLPDDEFADLVEFSKCQRCIFYLSDALKDEGTRLQNLGL